MRSRYDALSVIWRNLNSILLEIDNFHLIVFISGTRTPEIQDYLIFITFIPAIISGILVRPWISVYDYTLETFGQRLAS